MFVLESSSKQEVGSERMSNFPQGSPAVWNTRVFHHLSLSFFFFLTWGGLQYLCTTWNLGLGFDISPGTSSHPSGPQDVPSPAAPVSCENLLEMWHCGTPPLWPTELEIEEGVQWTLLQEFYFDAKVWDPLYWSLRASALSSKNSYNKSKPQKFVFHSLVYPKSCLLGSMNFINGGISQLIFLQKEIGNHLLDLSC